MWCLDLGLCAGFFFCGEERFEDLLLYIQRYASAIVDNC